MYEECSSTKQLNERGKQEHRLREVSNLCRNLNNQKVQEKQINPTIPNWRDGGKLEKNCVTQGLQKPTAITSLNDESRAEVLYRKTIDEQKQARRKASLSEPRKGQVIVSSEARPPRN